MKCLVLFSWLLGFMLLSGACSPENVVSNDTQNQVVSIGYTTRADDAIITGYTEIADNTTFRFIASESSYEPPYPSLNWSEIPESGFGNWASPYGIYCYTKSSIPGAPNWIPCDIGSDFKMTNRNPSAGQKLTVHRDNAGAFYKITAYSPPRGTLSTDKGIVVIPYKKNEPLMISEELFEIKIPRRTDQDSDNTTTAEMYKIYPLPEKFNFVEMHSKLTFAIYKEDVDFQLKEETKESNVPTSEIEVYGLGYKALLHPFTHDIGILYEDDDKKPYITDTYELTEENAVEGKRTLRYSVTGINIFPANYKLDREVPLKVALNISYDAGITYEVIEIRIPIETKASIEYMISFIVSRKAIRVTATSAMPGTWDDGVPPIPINVGGGNSTINLGSWTHDGWQEGSNNEENI